MNKEDVRKILAGISVASLLTGAGIGCTTQPQQSTAPSKETAPAQTQETKSPGKDTSAPGSSTGSEKGAGGAKTEKAPAPGS